MISSPGVDGDRRHLSNNKSSGIDVDGKYNSTVMRLVLAVILSDTYHITYNVQEPINNLSSTSSANYTNSSSETFVPHWEIIPTIVPYMGNLTCVSQHCSTGYCHVPMLDMLDI